MTGCILCIGSNLPPRRRRIARAVAALAAVAKVEAVSAPHESDDHTARGPRYINVAVRAVTDLTAETLTARLRGIERDLGRQPGSKETGRMPIDIDLICYGTAVVSPDDYGRPYFRACLADLPTEQ